MFDAAVACLACDFIQPIGRFKTCDGMDILHPYKMSCKRCQGTAVVLNIGGGGSLLRSVPGQRQGRIVSATVAAKDSAAAWMPRTKQIHIRRCAKEKTIAETENGDLFFVYFLFIHQQNHSLMPLLTTVRVFFHLLKIFIFV